MDRKAFHILNMDILSIYARIKEYDCKSFTPCNFYLFSSSKTGFKLPSAVWRHGNLVPASCEKVPSHPKSLQAVRKEWLIL